MKPDSNHISPTAHTVWLPHWDETSTTRFTDDTLNCIRQPYYTSAHPSIRITIVADNSRDYSTTDKTYLYKAWLHAYTEHGRGKSHELVPSHGNSFTQAHYYTTPMTSKLHPKLTAPSFVSLLHPECQVTNNPNTKTQQIQATLNPWAMLPYKVIEICSLHLHFSLAHKPLTCFKVHSLDNKLQHFTPNLNYI